jgi:hypothetical protein
VTEATDITPNDQNRSIEIWRRVGPRPTRSELHWGSSDVVRYAFEVIYVVLGTVLIPTVFGILIYH